MTSTKGHLCRGVHLVCALAVSASLGAPRAIADPGILLASGKAADSSTLATGDQLLLTNRTADLPFAGKAVTLSGFTGLVGYANEIAYVVVLNGSAAIGEAKASAGQMLLLRPYGAPASVEQFDAIRLAGKWSEPAKTAAPEAYQSLANIKASQELSVWFGRLGQTSFNVAASGSARSEQESRAMMGNEAVRKIRFSGASDPLAVEQLVVATFVDALKSGDVKTVAALIDPTPFGGRALAGGASDARLMAASSLIASHDWPQTAGAGAPQLTDGVWKSGDASLRLRTIDDFVFVSSISRGTK